MGAVASGVKLTQSNMVVGRVMVWGCCAAPGPGQFAITDGNFNSNLNFKTLIFGVTQQETEQKYTSKSTSGWLKRREF